MRSFCAVSLITIKSSLQLRLWEAKLPRTLHIADTSVKSTRAPPHVIMVNLSYHWLAILLLRPVFRPGAVQSVVSSPTSVSSTDPEGHAKRTLQALREAASAQCPSSANQIVRLLDRYDTLYGLRFISSTALQVAYIAGQVHLGMYFAASTPSAREKSRTMVNDCITMLDKMGPTWPSGYLTSGMLRRMLQNGERRAISLPPQPRGENLNKAHSSTSAEPTSPPPKRHSLSGAGNMSAG